MTELVNSANNTEAFDDYERRCAALVDATEVEAQRPHRVSRQNVRIGFGERKTADRAQASSTRRTPAGLRRVDLYDPVLRSQIAGFFDFCRNLHTCPN